MGKYFGTDGYRGEANTVLKVEDAFKIGRFLGWYYGKNHKANIVIGKDTRRSSYMFEYALAAGITASGADAYLLHVTTTPSVAYVVHSEDIFDCGIMISASHNPYWDNGIKLLNGKGEKMEEEFILEVEKYLDGVYPEEVTLATRDDIGKTIDYAEGRNRYVGYLISLATRSFKGKTVALDCANGASFTIAKSVFDALGARTYAINVDPDGTNINLGCGSTHIEGLQNFVKSNDQIDVGFAYDGDADRCLAVDEDGEIVDGDKIMYVCGRYMKERGELEGNKIVTTIMSNYGLYKALDEAGIGYEKTKVGDKYVYENMSENGYRLGGEQSGHIIFSKYATTGDGILTSLKVMEVMLEKKQSLKKLAEDVTVYPQVLKNVRVRDKKTVLDNEAVKKAIEAAGKELEGTGRVLVRESGTEPVIRVMAESMDTAQCNRLVDAIIDVMVSV
ncbi:MAG: phosphoglucosamine mutase [Lachnospiraceae bacterium]|nr:phosphoglucosamine mutase [Lachnospiraceae bacterium]